MKLILLGAPGCGKRTMAEQLVKEFGLKHISSGDIFRDEIKRQTPLGKKVKQVIDAGSLVSDELTVELIKPRIVKEQNYILDGFPRTLAQAEAMDDINIDAVILIDVPDKDIIGRITSRRVCSQGHIYNLKNIPPQKAGICDQDGLPLIQRKDDTIEVIKDRLKVYYHQTQPLIEYYQKKKLLKKVNGNQDVGKVLEEMKVILNKIAVL